MTGLAMAGQTWERSVAKRSKSSPWEICASIFPEAVSARSYDLILDVLEYFNRRGEDYYNALDGTIIGKAGGSAGAPSGP